MKRPDSEASGNTQQQKDRERRRHLLPAALLGFAALATAAVAVVLALAGTGAFASKESASSGGWRMPALPATTTSTAPVAHAIEAPSRIIIPVIGVDAKMVDVGLKPNGDMQVPRFGYAGWFKFGPLPGATGPAVIVGHVDTRTRQDVFYRLHELRPGDEFYVGNTRGDTAAFVVDYSESVLKTDLPTERIWEVTSQAVIRLITCGGDWDAATGHYLSNLIVYGHLVR